MKKHNKTTSNKKKVSSFSWIVFLGMMIVLGILGGLPAVLYGGDIKTLGRPYILWYVLYWAIIAAALSFITVYQKYQAFDKPMRELSEATYKVARGDFSIYLKPPHTSEKLSYINAMFEDFNTMVEELGSLETMKTDFISDVSHEIKTPLSVIQNYAAALQNEELSKEERQEYTETIMTAAQKLSTLVTHILRLNKLEHQEIFVPVEPYDVCRQLYDCALSFDTELTEKNIKFEAEIEDRAFLVADPDMVEIIWRNLLSNAIKFTPQNGVVRLVQTSNEQSIQVKIEDTGIGMNEETKQRLFEKFYQGDISRSNEGNGLGLALVSEVVTLLGGKITVTSEAGKGAIFSVQLPTLK